MKSRDEIKRIAEGLFEEGFTPRNAMALATEPYTTIDDVGEPAEHSYDPPVRVIQ